MRLRLRWYEKMFIEIDEPFKCEVCGAEVLPLGYTCRDHCPKLDYNKLRCAVSKKGYIIIYKCDKCGKIRRNKMANDDNFDLAMEIVKNNSYKTF